MNGHILAADIGGTKTLMALATPVGQILHEHRYANGDWPEAEPMCRHFLASTGHAGLPFPSVLSLAVAGPVRGRAVRMTNLNWLIDIDALAESLGLTHAILQNDLAATARAMPALVNSPHMRRLQGGAVDIAAPVAVLSLGTGLGEALLIPDTTSGHRVIASEGGHKAFAPFDADSARRVAIALQQGERLSRESWISGLGLPRLHAALHGKATPLTPPQLLDDALATPTSESATTVVFLCKALLAEAGDLALQYCADGGVILAGGLGIALAPWLGRPDVLAQFSDKTRYTDWLEGLPVALCTHPEAALLGAIRANQNVALTPTL